MGKLDLDSPGSCWEKCHRQVMLMEQQENRKSKSLCTSLAAPSSIRYSKTRNRETKRKKKWRDPETIHKDFTDTPLKRDFSHKHLSQRSHTETSHREGPHVASQTLRQKPSTDLTDFPEIPSKGTSYRDFTQRSHPETT